MFGEFSDRELMAISTAFDDTLKPFKGDKAVEQHEITITVLIDCLNEEIQVRRAKNREEDRAEINC